VAINLEKLLYCKYLCVLTDQLEGGGVKTNVPPFNTTTISSVFLPLKITFMIFLLQSNLHSH